VVEETSTERDWAGFREKLLNAKSKDRKGKEGIGGRYAVFDVEYELESGEGTRSKITFIAWCPDDAPQYVSASSGCGGEMMAGCRRMLTSVLAPHDVLVVQGGNQALPQRPRC
jgi:hypothetical protein